MNVQAQNYLHEVRDQYEDYPYPKRDPEDERKRIIGTFTGRMDLIISSCFSGRLDLEQPFRVLSAGGGTGDSAIFLAEQLKTYPKAEIIYLDISQASMAIAKKRAEIRGLKNIKFIHGSLLDLPNLGLGEFDYIDCTGVLHHLASPLDGLKALTAVLKPTGAMGLMLYAKYGRTGAYMIQEAMRQFLPVAKNKQDQVERCKRLLKVANPGNLFLASIIKAAEREIKDHGDIGIYDLFLHPQDVCFTVPEIYDLCDAAKLHLINFNANYYDGGRTIYNPRSYLDDPQLIAELMQLPTKNQQTVAEILHGKMAMHFFFVSKQPRQPVDARDENIVFGFNITGPTDVQERILKFMDKENVFSFRVPPYGAEIAIPVTPHLRQLISLIDGDRTLGEILERFIKDDAHTQKSELLKEFMPMVSMLSALDYLCMRFKGAPKFTMPNGK